ncbi:unnamed protein product [Prorocentrum cordatum]|uniref:Casein kinase I n=1 Tax=Prorocentrum cordatum TaxID=2364126 RepID=A0ABN9U1I5_9DINO|nr:unnamed protein product [Polarella glacialis]
MGKLVAAPPNAPQSLLGGRYRLGRKLGSGSFGDAFLVANARTGEEFAVKLESVKAKHPMLMYEARVLGYLQGMSGIPNVHYCGVDGDYTVMVMDLFGPSLDDMFKQCDRKFSLTTVLMIAVQMLYRIEHLHARGFIHRDVKPSNFLVGTASSPAQRRAQPSPASSIEASCSDVYMIDFGLAKSYRDPETQRHIPYSEGNGFSGTSRYCSINAHIGIEQSRRDDLQAIGYTLMHLIRGQLPWQGIQAGTSEEMGRMILDCKRSTSIETLCHGYPETFAVYLRYCQALRFHDRPDYAYLRRLFRDLLVREGGRHATLEAPLREDHPARPSGQRACRCGRRR